MSGPVREEEWRKTMSPEAERLLKLLEPRFKDLAIYSTSEHWSERLAVVGLVTEIVSALGITEKMVRAIHTATPSPRSGLLEAADALSVLMEVADSWHAKLERAQDVPGETPYVSTWILEQWCEQLDEHGTLDPQKTNLRAALWSVAQELKDLRTRRSEMEREVWIAGTYGYDDASIAGVFATRSVAMEWLKARHPEEVERVKIQNKFEIKRSPDNPMLWEVCDIDDTGEGAVGFGTEIETYYIRPYQILEAILGKKGEKNA